MDKKFTFNRQQRRALAGKGNKMSNRINPITSGGKWSYALAENKRELEQQNLLKENKS